MLNASYATLKFFHYISSALASITQSTPLVIGMDRCQYVPDRCAPEAFFLDHAFLVLFIPWTSCPLDESSPAPNHSAVRLSLYLPNLVSGFFYVLDHSAVSLFSLTIHFTPRLFPASSRLCCQAVSLHLPSTVRILCAYTHSAGRLLPTLYTLLSVFSLHLSTVLSCVPAPTHSSGMLSLYLSCTSQAVPVPTHSAVRFPCTYPLSKFPCAHTLMSGVPVPTHSSVRLPLYQPCSYRLSLYLPTLLSDFPATYSVPTLLSDFPYPLCCQVSLQLSTLLSNFPCTYLLCCQIFVPTHSATILPLYLPILLSGCYLHLKSAVRILCTYSLCCQDTPDNPNSAVRLLPAPTHSGYALYLPSFCQAIPCTYKLCCHVCPCTYPDSYEVAPVPSQTAVRWPLYPPRQL